MSLVRNSWWRHTSIRKSYVVCLPCQSCTSHSIRPTSCCCLLWAMEFDAHCRGQWWVACIVVRRNCLTRCREQLDAWGWEKKVISVLNFCLHLKEFRNDLSVVNQDTKVSSDPFFTEHTTTHLSKTLHDWWIPWTSPSQTSDCLRTSRRADWRSMLPSIDDDGATTSLYVWKNKSWNFT